MINNAELAQVVTGLLVSPENGLDEADAFAKFMQALTNLVCEHCGGEAGNVMQTDGQWWVGIRANESLPQDGGVWAALDPEGDL